MQGPYDPAGGFPRLSDLFREAERQAKEAIQVLRHPRWRDLSPDHPGSMDYALGLARLIRCLAESGLKAPASQASSLAEKIEILLELLRVEMLDLFKS